MREFGHMLEAFEYGAPPHGGMAWGIRPSGDAAGGRAQHPRGGSPSPRRRMGTDIMAHAPSTAEPEQLSELFICSWIYRPDDAE